MSASAAPGIRIKSIALPAEHGGWGFLLEPILLGLLLAPSPAGLTFAAGTIAMFLTRHPLKIVVVDWRRGRRFMRTQVAERFVLLYGALAVLGFGIAISLAENSILLPILLAAPLALVQVFYDVTGKTRALLPELSGSTALAASSSCILLAAGWSLDAALAVWAVLTARSIPSVLYVRARLRLENGADPDITPPIAAHVIAVVVVLGLAFRDLAPFLSALMALLLLGRAGRGLSQYRHSVKPKVIGFTEVAYGIATVLAFLIGYVLGI